jgi:hypothetical protein
VLLPAACCLLSHHTPQVEALLAERQQLSARVHGLQKDNDQLAELVGRLTRTLQVGEGSIGVERVEEGEGAHAANTAS